MKTKRPCLASARATCVLAAMYQYQIQKEEIAMANKKTAKKKRLKEQKRQEQAIKYTANKLGGR